MALLTFMTNDFRSRSQLNLKVLAQHGITKPLLCTDRGLVELGMVNNLAAAVGNDAAIAVFDGTPENPTQMAVEEAIEKYHVKF